MNPQQRDALKQALEQHSLSMAVKDAAPEDVAALPQDFAVPTYNANNQPLYDNQLFPAVNSVEDLVARGYATPDGQVTERGQMALSLRRVGALKEDYTLNDTGRAVLSKREDLLELDNLSLYGKAEELNLDDDGRGAMARFSDGAKELWKATQNLGAALYEEAEPAMGAIQAIGGIAKGPAGVIDVVSGVKQQLETDYTPEQRAATRIRTEEAIKEFSDQGTYTLLGAGELMMRGAMSTPTGIAGGSEVDIISQAQKDANILATRQARERVLNDAANVSVSEAVDQLTGVTEFVKSYQQAADVLGPERTKEVVEQGKAMGLAGSILNPAAPEAAAFAVGFKAARGITAPISGSLLRSEQKAQQVLAKTKELTALQKQAADYQFAIKTVEQQAARAEETAARLSKRGFVDRANSQITAANAIRRQAQETGVKLGGLQDEIARVSDDIATMTKDATVADKFNQMMQKAKEVPYMPITMVGSTLEYVGRNMIGIDKGLSKLASKIGVDKAYNAMNKISSLSGLGTVGAAAGLGPAAFIPAAIKTAWSTAPFIEGAGKFINLVGKEAMKSRADIGFWKRIYAMPNQGPVNRAIAGFMDTATLGGRVTDLGVRTTKGVLAAVPADLAFQYVGEGGKMDAGSIGEALSESVFFGGAGGGLGAITMGSKQKIRSLQNGNALNFYRTLEDPQQRVMFNGMPEDYRRAIGTFSATNPGARVMFTTIGGGGIDPNTNTIYINPNSSNPIKPLVTHEFMHHMMNNGIGDGIVAQLVGDGYQTGGILRTADGKYEPQYEAFKEEYVDRLRQQHAQMIKMREAIGDKIPANEREFQAPSEKYLAEEYFIESNVEDMLGLVESGKLGKMAGRMVINDKVRALGDSILNKSSILRDLHFKLGGVMDKNGKMVSGNGFLGGQMYQSPEIRRMFKKMVSDSVGRKGGFDQARVKAKEGVKLKINGKTDPILKSMVSFWEGDADGVPFLDKDGDFIPLKKETEEMRATAGLLLIDDQNKRQANGETIAEGQLVYNPDTQTWSGKYLTEDQIRILRLSGRFNNPQIRQLEMLNEAAKATLDPNAAPETRGNRFSIIYQAALKRNKKGKWRYDQIEPSLRDVVPYGVEITKNGNILIRIMSTNQMHANISKKAASKKGIQLYDGNIEAILRDVNKVIELHGEADGKPTDAHFKEKYGAAWETHKAFINSVFGNVGAGHKDINPLVSSDKVDAVVKTYRLDRINKATQMVGSTNLPYQNNLVKINYLPEGEPILDENGEPKDLRYTPSYEESQVRMPEAQRAMPEGEQTPTRFMPEGVDEDKFYSQLERVITDKVPTRATAQQIMATIDPTRGSGVKADEIKWSGIEQALASLEKDGKVSKDDLLNYLRNEGRVRFEEVTLGAAPSVYQENGRWYVKGQENLGYSDSKEQAEELASRPDVIETAAAPKFSQYVLPGGENYREVVLAMPVDTSSFTIVKKDGPYGIKWQILDKDGNFVDGSKDRKTLEKRLPAKAAEYRSSHFPDIPNYVAHMRTNERTLDDGSEGLFVEEFQSDRHQAGRKKGYRGEGTTLPQGWTVDEVPTYAYRGGPQTGTEWMVFDASKTQVGFGSKTREEAILSANSGDLQGSVADAPFRTTWPIQLFKRALRDAVDSGKDWIGWTTGETQNERFDLSKQVDSISVPMVNADGSRSVRIDPKDGTSFKMMVDSNGIVNGYQSADQFTGKRLDEVVGKDMADKIIALESPANFEGNDLKVGGSGMRGFYDNMLPKEVGKYVKQFGGKVEKADMTQSVEADIMSGEEAETGSIPIWKVNITPEMRKISQTGQMRFMPEGEAKIIDSNIPEKEGGKMRPSTWESLSKVGYSPEASEKTQIATTAPTYESIVKANTTQGMEVLDFSAGRGIGTKAMKAIGKKVGFNVEGYEPFSNEKTRVIAPEYEGEDSINQIPDNSKDIIINNAVLNVVPEDTGRQIVNQIYSKLKPGGSAFINVMGWNNIKNRLDNPKTQLVGPREVVTQKGTFQKGYTAQSLRALIEQELPDAKIVRTSHGDIGFKVTKPAPPAETMPVINQPAKTGQMRFLPEPVEKLSAFKGKRVQVLTSDLSLVGDVKYGSYTAKFQGGPGYLDNDGWGFTDKDAADGFVTRWERDGKPLIGLASLGSANHLNSLASRKAYAEKWKYLIKSGNLNKEEADAHIKEAMSRVINSDAKKVKPDWRNAAKMITNADDLSNYFDKIPWAAAPMFYEKLTAKTLPIKYPILVENGLDLESVANEYRQPEYQGADIGDLYAIAEYNGSTPEYRPDLNQAYPWRIKFTKKATLSEMHNVADLTTDPRAFTGKIVGGALAPQPLMVTGIQLDKLISGDIKGSVKPISLQKETLKTKSNKAKEFSSGNPKAYKSYEQIMAERELEKSKPKAKGNASAIANAAKLK